jgi:hypothetical protein
VIPPCDYVAKTDDTSEKPSDSPTSAGFTFSKSRYQAGVASL